MNKQKKSLLCMYVDDFCGIKEESFNFCIERRYTIREGKISRKSDEEIKDIPKDFWGDNVSAVTLLIGENGAGKTTLMRLLIKWFCQLSVGHIPQEKGALVINDDDKDKLIAFEDGKPWTIEINKCKEIVCIEEIDEITNLLRDIRLAYYTDTMTDLELSDTLEPEELESLQDDSLLTRLSNSMKNKYIVDNISIKDCIKREDFERQMKLFLYSKENSGIKLEFPIHYMKLAAVKARDEKSFKRIAGGNGSLVREAIDLWNEVFSDDANNDLPDIAKALLWELFSGTIISLLQWEKTLPNLEESIVTEPVRHSLRAYIGTNHDDWNTVFKHFFTNMFSDCERGFIDKHRYEEFHTVWDEQVEDNINSFLDVLKKIENGEFMDKWMPSKNAQNVWEFKLEYFDEKEKEDENERTALEEWGSLWDCYIEVAYLMPECRFDWKYASSGEINKANLYCSMRVVDMGECNNMWFLLDEPDNTFHPDWKRVIIQELLKICSIYNINSQMLISTHSPIMLSDVPKQAAILLKSGDKKENSNKSHNTENKQQKYPKSSPFGQQIYTLFKDSFFMEHGVIGAFADEKISKTYSMLVKLEKKLRGNVIGEKKLNEGKETLEKGEYIIKLIDEPLLRGHLLQIYNWCSRYLGRGN